MNTILVSHTKTRPWQIKIAASIKNKYAAHNLNSNCIASLVSKITRFSKEYAEQTGVTSSVTDTIIMNGGEKITLPDISVKDHLELTNALSEARPDMKCVSWSSSRDTINLVIAADGTVSGTSVTKRSYFNTASIDLTIHFEYAGSYTFSAFISDQSCEKETEDNIYNAEKEIEREFF